MHEKYRITNGEKFKLKNFDPTESGLFDDKRAAEEETKKALKRIWELQEEFYVDKRHSLLIVLQAMDTAGKDGTIDSIFSGINPIGCRVTPFKKPTEEELAHDFLWRLHKVVPAKGQFEIFNRSHYEDVLVVRVHEIVPKAVWKARYEHINNFEKLLADTGTIVLKFFLHISKDEQRERLQARLDNKEKLWKFDPNDLKERAHWDDYMVAYEDAIRNCSAPYAPWHVIPADKKWYRNYVVAKTILAALEKIDYKLPELKFKPEEMKVV